MIRAWEGGTASHCAVWLSDGNVVDASWPHGVQTRPFDAFMDKRLLVQQIDVTLPDEKAAADYLLSQIGAPYDWLGIAGYLAWRDLDSPGRHYCSGILMRAMLAGGLAVADPARKRWSVGLVREIAQAHGAPRPPRQVENEREATMKNAVVWALVKIARWFDPDELAPVWRPKK